MDHDHIIGLLGAYSLDAVDNDERQVIAAHLEVCTMCRTEVGQFQEAASSFADGIDVPWSLWQRVVRDIKSPDRSLGRQPWPWLSMVAATVIIALFGVVMIQQRRVIALETTVARQTIAIEGQNRQLDEVSPDRLLATAIDSPYARTAVLSGEAGSITFVIQPDGSALIVENTLPPLPGDHTYQLWAVIDGEVVSAAVLGPDPHIASLRIEGQVAVLALTVEQFGGVVVSDQEPAAVWLAGA
ncbi:MAG: anti-sigma factor [Acidimicrobiia bacterium]|nr:anti-sigma factor [Acidimicrobiia bacterium]